MLKKFQRLSKVINFKKAKTISSPFLTIKFFENGEDVTKFAFVISKKIDKRAVIRNKLKRILSKQVEEILEKIKTGQSIVIITKPGVLEKDSKELGLILKELLDKADLLR
jgi:ribonuclease P protein component